MRASVDTMRNDAIRARHGAMRALHGAMRTRHGVVRVATRRCACGQGAVRAKRASSLVLGCAHCALDSFFTQCTVYSHCLNHYSWTLFMNTVHGVLKKIEYKKIK